MTNDRLEEYDQCYQTQQINEDKRSNFTIIHIYSYIIMNYEINRKELLVCRLEYIWQTILFYISIPVGACTVENGQCVQLDVVHGCMHDACMRACMRACARVCACVCVHLTMLS